MSDLNRIGGGIKLLKYILKTEIKNSVWSRKSILDRAKTKPNLNKLKKPK